MPTNVKVDTEIGQLELVLVDGHRALVATPSGGSVVVRHKPYFAFIRFELQDGTWVHVPERGIRFVQRRDDMRPYGPEVGRTIAAKVVDTALQALQDHLEANPAALHDAAVAKATETVRRAREDAEAARRVLSQAENALAEAEVALNRLCLAAAKP